MEQSTSSSDIKSFNHCRQQQKQVAVGINGTDDNGSGIEASSSSMAGDDENDDTTSLDQQPKYPSQLPLHIGTRSSPQLVSSPSTSSVEKSENDIPTPSSGYDADTEGWSMNQPATTSAFAIHQHPLPHHNHHYHHNHNHGHNHNHNHSHNHHHIKKPAKDKHRQDRPRGTSVSESNDDFL